MTTSKKNLKQVISTTSPSEQTSKASLSNSADTQLDTRFYKGYYADLATLNHTELVKHWQESGEKEKRFPNFTALLKSKKLDPQKVKEVELDFDFYISYYPDLKKVGIHNEYLAKIHYLLNGRKEGRYPNLVEYLTSKGIDPNEADITVDFDFYTRYYPDLKVSGISNSVEAKIHYLEHGRNEGRLPSLIAWMEVNHISPKLIPANFDFQTIFDINAEDGIEIKLKTFLELISGRSSYPIKISQNARSNANYYLELAKYHLTNHHREPARNLLKVCLAFEKRGEFLELLGNIYLEEKDYESASSHYEEATDLDGVSKWLFPNLANCKKMLSQHRQGIEILLRGIEKNPEFSFAYDRLDEFVHEYWLKQQGALEAYSVISDRNALIAKASDASTFIYKSYLRSYGVTNPPEWVHSCNPERILIVGDFHISQCVRYRINQKIEQLEAAGKKVTAISWTDLAREQNALALHDVVIFYRVSAQPQVLKAIAQVNATGKLSIYEIDDLLFDPVYPPPIDSYGGYVDLNTFVGLTKGMSLFNAAARCCRLGLASTQPLADKLQALVFGKKCYVHRNGFDSLNIFIQPIITTKPTVDIFYGSGTLAHNSDFSDLVLPAITRLLDEYPDVRLVVAGHLSLSSRFLELYGDRIKQIPIMKNVQAYWSLLERADINLAVLHDDEFNGCKSELKWFEAAALGIPTVMSSTANYRDVISDGENGLMAATPEEWYQHLKTLITDPKRRKEIAEKAHAKVLAEYSIKALSININTVLQQALAYVQPASQPKRKKIALVNVYFPPQSHGGATRVITDNFDLLQRDYKDQFELCVFTSDFEHKAPYQMTTYSHQGSRVYRSTVLWRENMDWHPKDEKMGELFSEFLAAEQPDLVHFHCVQRLTGSIVEVTRQAKIPYIVTIHDAWWISDYQFLVDDNGKIYPEGHVDPYELHGLPNNVSMLDSIERMLYLKGLLRGASKALTVSECFAELYRKNEIPAVHVNKNGVSESVQWHPKDTSYTDKIVCAHIGGMAEHKGYFLLKYAITKLQPKNIELLVVDHSQQEGYSLQDHWGKVPVTFIGPFKQKRVTDLYHRIDVLCAPSTWPESYGLVSREAAACGCWVIASNMGGIGEDVAPGESGFVIEPDAESLIACLEEIDQNPARFKGMANAPEPRWVSEQVKELATFYVTEGHQA
ncbi:MAG: glycosyltransferase [Methylococcaceae bacterium]